MENVKRNPVFRLRNLVWGDQWFNSNSCDLTHSQRNKKISNSHMSELQNLPAKSNSHMSELQNLPAKRK